MCSPTASVSVYVQEHRAALVAFIERQVGDSALAEDILHDSLLRTLRSEPAFEGEEHLARWLYRVLRNAITDAYRRHDAAARALERFAQEHPEPMMAPQEEAALCACFRLLLPTMKKEYAALIEAELDGADPGEIAARFGIAPGNLRVRRHRARQQLRARLEETCRSCAQHGCVDCSCTPPSTPP